MPGTASSGFISEITTGTISLTEPLDAEESRINDRQKPWRFAWDCTFRGCRGCRGLHTINDSTAGLDAIITRGIIGLF